MKILKTQVVPARTEEVVDIVICDLCKQKIIEKSCFAVDEIHVSHRTGDNYPEGGNGQTTSFDLCGKCFDEKLVPWLESQGAHPLKKDWDW